MLQFLYYVRKMFRYTIYLDFYYNEIVTLDFSDQFRFLLKHFQGVFLGFFNKFLKKREYAEKDDDDYKSENQREQSAENKIAKN